MKIGIVGMGIVGESTAKVLENFHEIYPYDKYKQEYDSKDNFEALAKNARAVFFCLPTPMKKSGGIDYSAIESSLQDLEREFEIIGRKCSDALVVIRSTAVSGTTDDFASRYEFRFAFNPEFLTEKNALLDMKNTNRVVIGAEDEESKNELINIYKPIFPNAKYVNVDRKTAEMIKYASNVVLAGQIGIANEIYQICKHAGLDYGLVKESILLDERIGRNISVPGPDGDLGFGGKCFPKDLNALIYLAREKGYRPHLLEEVWRLNEKIRKNKDWLGIKGATTDNNFKEE